MLRALRRRLSSKREPPETREALIARKATVIAEIASTRARLAELRASRPDARREAELEAQLQALMAEERRLRLVIDRTAPRGSN